MKLWIARDKDGTLRLFQNDPELDEWAGKWKELYNEDDMTIYPYAFPEVTLENSPQQVELKLVKGSKNI